MNAQAHPDLDVNVLMSQIRETGSTPKAVVAPAPQRQPSNNGAGNKKQGSQESFNQQAIGILQGLSGVSNVHQQSLIQLQQNAVVQNNHLCQHRDQLNEQREQLDQQKARLEEQEKTIKSLASRPAAVYIGNGRVFTKTSRGLPLIVRADDLQITAALVTDGIWDNSLTRLYERYIKNDMKYLEIGTHVGYFATMAASLVGYRGAVHAFEPNPVTFEFLEQNMRLNQCTHITNLIQQAASNETGKTTFNIFSKNPGGSTLSQLPETLLEEWRERPTPVEVRCTRLDDYYAGKDLQFDFIKIDAEGAEPLIFEGGADFFQNRIKPETIIAMEFNPPAITGLKRDPKVFAQHLFDIGFKLWRIVNEDDLQPVNSPAELDAWCITELLMSRSELPAR